MAKTNLRFLLFPKGNFGDKDFQNLLLIGFDRTNIRDEHHLNRMVHFFFYMIINLNGYGKNRTMI